jgi:membrane protease YdiL (CAAX protease family)
MQTTSAGEAQPAPAAIAPTWHTVVLIAGILAVSATGASRIPGAHGPVHRLATYAVTAGMELALFTWVMVGLRLKKTPLRSLLGENSLKLRSIALDFGIALLFWIGSMMILGTLALAWVGVEAVVTHRPLTAADGKPDPSQQRTMQTLVQLAPSNAKEIAAWAVLCLVAGFVEECVFRGYLQRQFIAWGRGSAAAGVVFSALIFGAAHGYEGARAMFLIAVFGVLFSLLALFRRSLRAGIIAHCWQDLLVGLVLALLKSHHIV